MLDLEWFRYSQVNGRVSMLVNDRLLIFWEKMAILSSGRRVSKNKKLPWPFWKWSATALPVTVARMTCMRYSRFVDALYPFKLNPGGAYALSLDICFGSLSCPPKHVSTHFKASLPWKITHVVSERGGIPMTWQFSDIMQAKIPTFDPFFGWIYCGRPTNNMGHTATPGVDHGISMGKGHKPTWTGSQSARPKVLTRNKALVSQTFTNPTTRTDIMHSVPLNTTLSEHRARVVDASTCGPLKLQCDGTSGAVG